MSSNLISNLGLQEYLNEAQSGITDLNEGSSMDTVAGIMEREGKRLDQFVSSSISAAENIIHTGLVANLVKEPSYFLPPLPRPRLKLRPDNKYYYRFASKEMIACNGFHEDWVVPKFDYNAGIEFEFSFIADSSYSPQSFDVEFSINYNETMKAFEWLFNEWRRPMCQLLRGIANLELWRNGNTIDAKKGVRVKDPEILLKYHLEKSKGTDDHMVSMRSSFSVNDSDESVVQAIAVFLSIFDAVYKLTIKPANPDCLLHHYDTLLHYLPKAPFRITSVFPWEK